MTDKSFVYIAGAGPGNKEYITLKTFELIKTCDCIIYDALIDDSVLDNAKEGCKNSRLTKNNIKLFFIPIPIFR